MAKRILIIDDDQELSMEISAILEDEGFLVDMAANSSQGEARLKKNVYDVILLDFKMPGLNGVELLEKINNEFHLSSGSQPGFKSKIFLISGRPFLGQLIIEKNLSHLVNGILSKPFDIDLLLSKIKE